MGIAGQKVSKIPVRKHSKTGCITCKVRKKRCSEDKPVCSDCARLGFTCMYVPRSFDKNAVQKCKDQVEMELFVHKNKKKFVAEFEGIASGGSSSSSNGSNGSDGSDSQVERPSEDVEERALADEFETEGSSLAVVQTKSPSSPYLSQPLSDPINLHLDPVGMHLYDYYRDHLGKIISIAPLKQNYYLQVFLPMAHRHRGILYGLMAWSAHHLSISQEGSETRDDNYCALANRYTLESLRFLRSEIDTNFLWSLAQLLILCGAEICQGDVSKWKILLKYAADLIEKNVGGEISHLMSSFTSQIDTTTRYWLLANFIYHDVMCSRGTHFPIDQYNKVLSSHTDTSPNAISDVNMHVDPLHGVNRPILLLMGDITNLVRRMKNAGSFGKSHPKFREYMDRAFELQTELFQISPDVRELQLYEESSLMHALCLELFQLMKLSALLHLKTTCLRQSKHTWEIQHFWLELFEKLDLILGTKLEGCLCFPMFICGINATDQEQKRQIESRFSDIAKRYKCYNFQRARTVMRKVWLQDDSDATSPTSSISHTSLSDIGSLDIGENTDWYDIVDAMGWDISFA
ncbi:ZYRO0B02574p [Zygosaccharomyces rouxii]|uniref:ZYRO0B02574p n=2 Tax=Zygosaccharomyces rouxii TaxID=4956 RepID=C5DQS3_ZYGRC|nr:uncharacterized protein ZYRO0B02574g [Zygosaccharomyces rouxii]KAH9200316.1 fungal-specific transcription factor domain-containing protein [Zygosaccharomyces rouxii]CAR26134.1 ZYRO0B02574p [Zygosaccharomyces rouxii]